MWRPQGKQSRQRNSICKGFEVRTNVACSRKRKKARVLGVYWVRGWKVGHEIGEVLRGQSAL